MTITYLAGSIITGLSSDTKPTTASNGSIFIETDTGSRFIINSGTWTSIVGGNLDGLTDVDLTTVAPSNTNVLSYTTTGNKWVPATAGSGSVTASSTDTFTNKTIEAINNTIKNTGPVSVEMWVDSTGPTYYARDIKTGVVTSNANFRTLIVAVITALATGSGNIGGTIALRKGTYVADNDTVIGSASYPDSRVRIVGEGMDVTIIKRSGTAGHLFTPNCNFEFEDLTLDGDAIATQLISCGEAVRARCTNVKFARHTDIGLWYGINLKSFITDKCVFEDPRGTQDQHAFTCTEYGIVRGCTFDRLNTVFTSAIRGGSCLTSGGGDNILISNNRIVKANTFQKSGFGCSIEAWDRSYNNVIISNNIIVNGEISVGASAITQWDNNMVIRNVVIDGNVCNGAEITVQGPDSSWTNDSGKVRNVTISNNIINKSWDTGLRLYYLSGQININDNTIIDSNIGGLTNTGNNHGCIHIYNCTDMSLSNNKIYMTATATNNNPFGLRLDTTDRITAKGNTFYNTTGNPSYTAVSTNTNKEIQNNTGINDDIVTIKQIDLASGYVRIHGNDNVPIPLINAEGGGSPNQHFHILPDLHKQTSATDNQFFFGYNAQFTSYSWYSVWSGSNKEYFKLDAANDIIKFHAPIFIGDNYLLKLNETGLTAEREFTFPDIAGKVAVVGGPDIAQNPLNKRWGTVQPGYGTAAATVGVMDGLCQQFGVTAGGTNSVGFDTTEGKTIAYQTANSSGVVAGLLSNAAGGGLGRRLFGGRMICRFKLDSTTSARFYFGLTSATSLPISDTPLASGDHGIIVGFSSADTNYQIRHNDGATVTTDQLVGPGAAAVAKTTSTAFHTIEINWTASGNYNVIYDGTTHTVSTDLPATTADLYPNLMVQTSAAVQRTFTLRGLYIEADK